MPFCAKHGSNSNAFSPSSDAYNTQRGSYRLLEEASSRRCTTRSRGCRRPLVLVDTGKSDMPSSTLPTSSKIWQADRRTSTNSCNSCSTTPGTATPVHSEPAACGLVQTWLQHQAFGESSGPVTSRMTSSLTPTQMGDLPIPTSNWQPSCYKRLSLRLASDRPLRAPKQPLDPIIRQRLRGPPGWRPAVARQSRSDSCAAGPCASAPIRLLPQPYFMLLAWRTY